MPSIKKYQGKSYVRGHLMNDHLGGIGEYYNLFPISYKANSEHKNTAEAWAKQALRKEYELWPGNNFASQYYYVNYSVEAVCYSNDLSKNPTVKFICTANRANGGSHTSEIISDAKGYGESRIVGASSSNLHYHNSWSSNNNLYGWSAKGRGESKHTEKSRERSKIFTPYHVMTPLVDNDNIDFLRDMAIEYILESEWDENIISRIVYFLNETTNISDIKKYLPKDE